ncbi:MAG: hypothetical protein D6771_09250, partial [Zetaproteobacteria bacterium]
MPVWVWICLWLAACGGAQHPDAGVASAINAGGAGAGGGQAGAMVPVRLEVGASLRQRFPTMRRLVLTVQGGGFSLQTEMPLSGTLVLNLPANAQMQFTFDAFDATGQWLARGASTATITGGAVLIPVPLNPVPAGSAYADPLTGQVVAAPIAARTVQVVDAASGMPIAGAVVVAGGRQQTTDASGLARFPALAADAAVHAFFGGFAASAVGSLGGFVRLPIRSGLQADARIAINPPPQVNASTLADVYLTDGWHLWKSGHQLGDANPNFVFTAMEETAAPIGVTAMIEPQGMLAPWPDFGFASRIAWQPHLAASPLAWTLPDPYAEPRLPTLAWRPQVNAPPAGLSGVGRLEAAAFAVDPYAGAFRVIAHRAGDITPPNAAAMTLWAVADAYAQGYVLAL